MLLIYYFNEFLIIFWPSPTNNEPEDSLPQKVMLEGNCLCNEHQQDGL